jgi:ABC-type uncharacterized transport system substrate-binding protein
MLKTLLLALALIVPAALAEAHPHVWIRATATLQFENGKIVGILNEWLFDDFFSSALIGDFDKNKDKKFDDAEIKDLHENAFTALKDFGYFTHVRVNGKDVPITETRDFTASITKDTRVLYRFVAVLPKPIDPRVDKFDASVFDDSYYVDVEVNPSIGVQLAGSGSEGCKYGVIEDKAAPLYFGAAFPRRIEIRCETK